MSDFKDKIKTFNNNNNDDYFKREQQRIYDDYFRESSERAHKEMCKENKTFRKLIYSKENKTLNDDFKQIYLDYSMKTYLLNSVYLYLMQNRDKWSVVFNKISVPVPANKTIDEELENILLENGIEIEKGNYVFYIKDSI